MEGIAVINSVKSGQQGSSGRVFETNQESDPAQTSKTRGKNANISDTVEIGNKSSSAVTYTKQGTKKLSSSDIEAIKRQAEEATENLRKLVEDMILKQGKSGRKNQYRVSGETVSDRIVDFAIAVSGNDKTKLAELKASIDKGFAAAQKSFGGELPGICSQTYDAIMEKLDKWAQEN